MNTDTFRLRLGYCLCIQASWKHYCGRKNVINASDTKSYAQYWNISSGSTDNWICTGRNCNCLRYGIKWRAMMISFVFIYDVGIYIQFIQTSEIFFLLKYFMMSYPVDVCSRIVSDHGCWLNTPAATGAKLCTSLSYCFKRFHMETE